MDLNTIYDSIKNYAMDTQGVEMATIGQVYTIWNSLHMKYGAFNAILNYVTYTDENAELHFTFYYGDKVANDSSNLYDIQTAGFNVLRNVIRHLIDEYELEGYDNLIIYPYTQRFADTLAGAYCDVTIYVPLDPCFNYDKD
jgi:hypothetical protein